MKHTKSEVLAKLSFDAATVSDWKKSRKTFYDNDFEKYIESVYWNSSDSDIESLMEGEVTTCDLKSEWVKDNFAEIGGGEIMIEDIPEEIKRLACENVAGSFDGVVYGNSFGECWGDSWTSSTRPNPDSGNIIIYTMPSSRFSDVSLENIFGDQVREVIDYALAHGLNPDYEYDAEEVVAHAQGETTVAGATWNELLVDYWCEV